jgi:hypothetical protein
MPEVPEAPLVTPQQIAHLANLYDLFYHALGTVPNRRKRPNASSILILQPAGTTSARRI